MDSDSTIMLISIIILLVFSALFSSAETALTTVNKVRLRSLSESGSKRAALLIKITDNPSKLLSAILIGNNIVNITTSALATLFVQDVFGNHMITAATFVVTILVLIFGEITPKTIATLHAEKFALAYTPFIYFLMIVLTPVIIIINALANIILRILGIDSNSKKALLTETELRTIVDVGHEEGLLETDERAMIKNVFDFGNSCARDIMIPRIDMTMVEVNCTYDELIESFYKERYTRIPVYEHSSENVIGIVNIKDVFFHKLENNFNVRDYMREAYFTHEYKRLSELLFEMRTASVNISIILDEYGAAIGMLSLEDLLEEIVGEIRDEYDGDEEDALKPINEFEYLLDGQMKLDDFNEAFNSNLTSDDYDSLGGFIIEKLDRLAEENDEIEIPGYKFVVTSMDKNRIDKIHVYITNSDTKTDTENISDES